MLKNKFRTYYDRYHIVRAFAYFVKWCVMAGAIGVMGGIVGGAFAKCIGFVTAYRTLHSNVLYLMPVIGLLIVWLYQVTHEEENRGTNMVLESISKQEIVTGSTGPLIFISTVLTHLVGGSAGREGAALQIGGTIGTLFGRFFRLDDKQKKIATMCGMASVFSALFGTPVAASVFCMEVVNVGIMYYAAFLPCLISSFISMFISGYMGVEGEIFHIAQIPEIGALNAQPIILLGIGCALLSIVECVVFHEAEQLYRKYLPNPYIRILAASGIFIAAVSLLGTRLYCGSSTAMIDFALQGGVKWESFLLKLLLTAVVLGGGFKGGEIVPTLCIGASFGALLGSLIGYDVPLMAACGMIALFAGVTNCPISSILIGLEMFGGKGLTHLAIAVSISFALSGYFSLYKSQKFAYSKIRNEFINKG